MRPKQLTLAALALAAGLSLTACQGSGDSAGGGKDSGGGNGSGGSSSSAAGENASGSSGGEAATGESAQGSSDDQVTTGSCKTANLTFRTAHGMGEGDLMVTMKNTGDTCSLKGFPGVDLKAGSDTISAERSDVAPVSVVLNRGEETRFTLHYPPNDSGGSGVKITSIVVTPPNETHSKTLPVALSLPVTDGSEGGAGVRVDPVGTGKQ